MPAASKSQQRFFGMVHALQKGKLKPSDLPPGVAAKVKQAAASMTDKAATDFASTPSKELPQHVAKEDFSLSHLSFSQYLAASQQIMEALTELSDDELQALDEKWKTEYRTPESKRGMFAGMSQSEMKSKLAKLKASGPHSQGSAAATEEKELNFALRAKHGWGKA